MRLDCFTFSDKGGREYNEDSVGLKSLTDGEIIVLADGLGGHVNGDVASKCIVNTMIGTDWNCASDEMEDVVQKNIAFSNDELVKLCFKMHVNMKSTVVALMVKNDRAVWANVGDSRLYHIHNGRIAAMTADHSVAYMKYQSGEITRAQISFDEDQSSLLRALGSDERCKCDIASSKEPLTEGDGFLLCSDGLWEYVRDGEILVDCLKSQSAQEWAYMLLVRAMERFNGDNDNLSLATVKIFGQKN